MGAGINLANKATYYDQPSGTSHQINVTVAEGETIVFLVTKGTGSISVASSSGTVAIRKNFLTNRIVAGDVVGATAGIVTLTISIGASEVASITAVPVSSIVYSSASTGVSNSDSLTDSVSSSLGKVVFIFARAGNNTITITSPSNAEVVANLVTAVVDSYMGFRCADIGTSTSQAVGFSSSATQNSLMMLCYDVTDDAWDDFGIEAELSTGVWTDITEDIDMGMGGIVADGGMRQNDFLDLLASTGRLTFTLDNSGSNSAGLPGYYTPGHANCRTGWDENVAVRLWITNNSITTYKWQGWVNKPKPTVGTFRRPVVQVTARDWFDVASRTPIKQQPIQLNKRADEVATTIIDAMDKQPLARSFDTGRETFAQALDAERDERDTVYSVLNKLAKSELGRFYITHDADSGGTLVFEQRATRLLTDSSDRLITLDENMDDMQVDYDTDKVNNEIRVLAYPRNIGATDEVIATLQSRPSVQPGQTRTFTLYYRDPQQLASRISAFDFVDPPVSGTDILLGSVDDGASNDLDGDATVTIDFGANAAEVSVENTGTQALIINKLELKGKIIRLYEPLAATARDATSIAARGLLTLDFDMPYQQDVLEAQALADYLLAQRAEPRMVASKISFMANKDPDLLEAAIRGTTTSRFRAIEYQSAIEQDYFINGWTLRIGIGGQVDVEWTPCDADETQYWIIGISTAGETTVVA